ncbi:MAG: FHA domain-containing protein [Chloroflexota bacterium]|nr:FHA domain-containing protein [Chloroflexota bacterium]
MPAQLGDHEGTPLVIPRCAGRDYESGVITIMTKDLLRKGIALAKAGRNATARDVLGRVVKDNPRSVPGWLWLAGVVETQRQRRYCLEKVLQLDPQNKAARRALTQATPEAANDESVRKSVASVFDPLGHEFYCAGESADRDIDGQRLLLEICQEIFSTSFSVFDLSPGDRDVYLEMGIALGLNRPIVAIVREKTSLPPMLREHNIITYADFSDLQTQLSQLCDQDFPPTTQPTPDHCYFCDRACESMATPPDENSYLVLNRSKLLWRNLMQSLAPPLASYHLYPAYLTDKGSGPMLCEVSRKVLAAQFVLCHLGALSDESSYLALGMAIGSRAPWVLLSQKDDSAAPSVLRGVDRIEYAALTDIESPLLDTLATFLGRITASSTAREGGTALLSLPFWMQLNDWISHVAHPPKTHKKIQGTIRAVQYKGQKHLAEHIIPTQGLIFGRSADCDVVMESPSVSSRHFQILRGRSGKHFVEDLHSKNGTFLNGNRLPPGQRVAITVEDTIRIPGARFLIWDDRPLPDDRTAPDVDTTGMLPPILRIEIPEIPPPTYLNTWNHPVFLTVLLPDGRNRSMFEVQTYYPMGRILAELVKLLDLPDQGYCFKIKNRRVGNDETPLSIGVERGDVLMIVPTERNGRLRLTSS